MFWCWRQRVTPVSLQKQATEIQTQRKLPYRLGDVLIEEADVDVVRERLWPSIFGAIPADLLHFCRRKATSEDHRIKLIWKIQMRLSKGRRSSPSSGLMSSWKNSGQLTTTTSPTLAACQHVRLSHIHGHSEEKTPKSDYTRLRWSGF